MRKSNIKKVFIICLVMILSIFAVSCSKTNTDNENNQLNETNEILIGKITSVNDNSVGLDIISGKDLVSDKTVLSISNDTKFISGNKDDLKEGYLLTFTITGEVAESYPTQTKAKEIQSIEEDELITLDPREAISGLFDGEFPEMIITLNMSVEDLVVIDKDMFIVVEIEENPTTGYLWKLKENEEVKNVGNDYIASNTDANIVGSGGNRYFGFIGEKIGKYTLEFELFSPSNELSETRTVAIEVR